MALEEARIAYLEKEIPVGCVIVDRQSGVVLAKAHNMCQQLKNPNLHAEMIAITTACNEINNKNLSGCDLYVSLEPCVMCASAISNARIGKLYYAASDQKQGSVENGLRFYTTGSCFHRPEVYPGLLSLESEAIILSFFRQLRKSQL